MQQRRGRIILPDKPIPRFRLPEIPEELGSGPRPSARTGRAAVVVGWLGLSALCFWGAEGALMPSAWAGWITRLSEPPDARSDQPSVAQPAKPLGLASDTARQVAAAPSTAPVRYEFVSLPPVGRAAPATHGGANQSGFAHAAPTRDEGLSLQLALRERDARLQPFGLAPHSEADAPSMEPAPPRLAEPPEPRQAPQARAEQLESEQARPAAAAAPITAPPIRAAAPAPFQFAPRVDAPSVERPAAEPSNPTPPPEAAPAIATSGLGCEEARAAHEEVIDVAGEQGAPDVERGAYARVLEDWDRYAGCGLDHELDVSICVAVLNGAAKGVTIKTQPADKRVAACVARAVRRMTFPRSPRMDVVRTELIVR